MEEPMEGNFDKNLILIWDGRGVVASGPLANWQDDEVSVSIQVAIQQNGVTATGRSGDDIPQGADRFIQTAASVGGVRLLPGPAVAAGWAFVRGADGIEVYEWTVPVRLAESLDTTMVELAHLPDGMVRKLALLHDAPPGIAESTIALLPYGSRSALIAYGFIRRLSEDPDDLEEVEITPAGWQAIRAAAEGGTPVSALLEAGSSGRARAG